MLRYNDFLAFSEEVSIAWRGFFPEWQIEEFANVDMDEYQKMVEDKTYYSRDLFSLLETIQEDVDNDLPRDTAEWYVYQGLVEVFNEREVD